MAYYIYVYDIPSKEDLRKLDDIIKTYIPKYPGADDKKLDLKFNAIKDQVKNILTLKEHLSICMIFL